MWEETPLLIHNQNPKLAPLNYNRNNTVFSEPEKNIAQLGLREGDHVADLGAGSGFYAAAAGAVVGTSGQVYAVEVQKDMLGRVDQDMKDKGVHNVKVVWGDIEHPGGTRLRENSIDAALVCNVLFQIENLAGLVEETKRILKPGGRVLVIDWMESFGQMGPHPDQVVTVTKAKELFDRAGFVFEKDILAGAHHYGFVLTYEK